MIKAAPKNATITEVSPDRKAAEWVLSVGGTVELNVPLHEGKLPPGEWWLRKVILGECPHCTDADLKRFAGCTWLNHLNLTRTPITGSGLASLKGVSSLRELLIGGDAFCDEGAQSLESLQQLTVLRLVECKSLTDRGLEPVGKLTELGDLKLTFCELLTDASVSHLKGLTKLRKLGIASNKDL